MRVFALGAALGGAMVPTWSCGGDVFSCQLDDECGPGGTCQAIGHCSFPDDACASGQRFGDNAGSLSGDCVVVDDATAGGDTTSSTGGAPSPEPTTAAPSTTSAVDGSDTVAADGSSTGAIVPPCSQTYLEPFDGDALDPDWIVSDDTLVSVADGAVTLTVPATAGVEYVLIRALGNSGVDLREGWVRAEISAVPNELRKQGTLTVWPDEGQFLWLAEGGIRPIAPDVEIDGLGDWDPVAHRWLQIRGTAGDLVFEYSADARTWTEAGRAAAPAGLAAATVVLTAGHYEDVTTPAAFTVETLEVCYD